MHKNNHRKAMESQLSHIPGFRGCSHTQLAEIDRLTDRTTVLPGRYLVQEGMIGHELFVILSGTAAVTRRGRMITTMGPGDYFGELAAIDTNYRNASLTAITTLEVLVIGPRELSSLMGDIPGFRDALLRGMARRLRAADDTIDRMSAAESSGPLAEIHRFEARESV